MMSLLTNKSAFSWSWLEWLGGWSLEFSEGSLSHSFTWGWLSGTSALAVATVFTCDFSLWLLGFLAAWWLGSQGEYLIDR